jgi:death-on-curing family protein
MKVVLSVVEVEYVAFQLARELLSYNEPIPDFATRFLNILESCLAVPFQQFNRKSLYRTDVQKAAILYYLMIKNHPFQNGNKRIALMTLFYYLYRNGKWLKVDAQSLYRFSLWVAESPADYKDEVIRAIEKFISKNLVAL